MQPLSVSHIYLGKSMWCDEDIPIPTSHHVKNHSIETTAVCVALLWWLKIDILPHTAASKQALYPSLNARGDNNNDEQPTQQGCAYLSIRLSIHQQQQYSMSNCCCCCCGSRGNGPNSPACRDRGIYRRECPLSSQRSPCPRRTPPEPPRGRCSTRRPALSGRRSRLRRSPSACRRHSRGGGSPRVPR